MWLIYRRALDQVVHDNVSVSSRKHMIQRCIPRMVRVRGGNYGLSDLWDDFWITDDRCNQDLWLLVMGSNPSSYTRNPRWPVHSVSLPDVYEFLGRLNNIYPDARVRLPSYHQMSHSYTSKAIQPAGPSMKRGPRDPVNGNVYEFSDRDTVDKLDYAYRYSYGLHGELRYDPTYVPKDRASPSIGFRFIAGRTLKWDNSI